MCELCSSDVETKKKAIAHNLHIAGRLNELANKYEEFASGQLDPHSNGAAIVAAQAKNLIRLLVDEWV